MEKVIHKFLCLSRFFLVFGTRDFTLYLTRTIILTDHIIESNEIKSKARAFKVIFSRKEELTNRPALLRITSPDGHSGDSAQVARIVRTRSGICGGLDNNSRVFFDG